ncbi:hypothetical protein [Thalassotalea crassostreae]|uniref:hypothetical protein n=1 Tax=Thalassotalea crassostreae TaxID=1763536 RepID=UPI0012FDD4AF|nr:hypothetical protein [Thalassotalea crassostreae]
MMKKILIACTTVAVLLFSNVNVALAEDGKRFDKNVTWKNVVKINFKNGKRGEALKIIKNYYEKATEKAGTRGPETVMEFRTGDYDLLVVWHMPGGVNDMTWEDHPDNKKWRAALNDIAGGEDKAKEILDNFSSLIDNAENDIAIVR